MILFFQLNINKLFKKSFKTFTLSCKMSEVMIKLAFVVFMFNVPLNSYGHMEMGPPILFELAIPGLQDEQALQTSTHPGYGH